MSGMNEQLAISQLNRALSLLQHGQPAAAKPILLKVRQAFPDSPQLYFALGLACAALLQNEAALEHFAKAIELAPAFAAAYINQGVLLKKMGQPAKAIACYNQAMALQPASAAVLNNRGSAYLMLHQVDEAISDFKQALELEPGYADAYCNLGNAFTELNRFEAARLALQQALALDPSMADAHLALGNALDGLQRFDEAVASFDAAIQLNPRYAAAFCNKGNALRTLARYDEALACYERALKLQPADVAAMRGKANTLVGLQRYPEALAQFDRALALEADQALTRFDKGLLLLLLGDYASGWALYEARKQHEKLARYTCNLRQFDWPEWQGERELTGKTLLLHQEQGLGDTLQMLRYVPLLAELGAKVVLLVSAPLQRMAASVQGASMVVTRVEALPAVDLHCPFMSLPYRFQTTLATVPASVPYLVVPSDVHEAWAARLPATAHPRIGVVWSGSRQHRNDHNRSIDWPTFAGLFTLPAEFHSLQKDYREDEAMRAVAGVQDHAECLQDFADTAGLIAQLDAVITVDSSVAHLAAALGKPTWILLPANPDFRWGLESEQTPWYPTVRLFRQPAAGDWSVVLQAVKACAQDYFGLVTAG